MRKLTPKQQRFVDEYLIDLNATQAAIRAGYSQKTARVIASENLLKPDIVAAVQSAQTARAKRTQVDADWVLERLETEAKADLADIYDDSGALKPVKQWPLIWRQGLISGVETAQEFEEVDGKKVPAGLVHKVKISDRIKRVELIGKHMAVSAFVERHEHTGKDGGPIQTEEISDSERARRVAFLLSKATRETVQ
jgi:phage terminase small subunit